MQRRMRKRRRTVLLLAMLTVLALCSELFVPNPRSTWAFPRSSDWWENVVLANLGQHDWMENFRMSRKTYQYLCDQLRPLIKKQNTRLRRPVSTECQLAITLWVLATPCEYHSVAHLFGVARCTVCQIVKETYQAIVWKLIPIYINFPTGDELKEVVKCFRDKWSVPQCAGSIDGSHILVTPSAMNHTD